MLTASKQLVCVSVQTPEGLQSQKQADGLFLTTLFGAFCFEAQSNGENCIRSHSSSSFEGLNGKVIAHDSFKHCEERRKKPGKQIS